MTQFEEQLNNKFGDILQEIRVKRNSYIISDEEDAENNRPGQSNFENRILRKKHASNIPIYKEKNQDDRFQPSERNELGQVCTPLGIVNETLNETIILKEHRQKADHHSFVFVAYNIQRAWRRKN